MLLRRSAHLGVILLLVMPGFAHECGYDWPKNEVPWIITGGERAAFYALKNDEERTRFIEMFWARRDPTPDTLENEFKDTYYERVIFANEHYSTAKQLGFQTPRGRIYVMYGAPDTLQRGSGIPPIPLSSAVVGNQCEPTSSTAGPYEIWRYQHIAGVDHVVTITFADVCGSGALLPIVEQGDAGWLSAPPTPKYRLECGGKYDPNKPPEGLVQIVCGVEWPEPKFKELEEIVSHKISLAQVPVQVGFAFKAATSKTVEMTINITVPPSGLKWAERGGSVAARVQLYGRLTTLAGYIAESFERDSTVSDQAGPLKLAISEYLAPGLYRIDLAVKDVYGDTIGTFSRSLPVPDLVSWCQQ